MVPEDEVPPNPNDEDFELLTVAENAMIRAQIHNRNQAALLRVCQLLGVPEQGPHQRYVVMRSRLQRTEPVHSRRVGPPAVQLPTPFQLRAATGRAVPTPDYGLGARPVPKTSAVPKASLHSVRPELLQQQLRPTLGTVQPPTLASGSAARLVHTAPPNTPVGLHHTREGSWHGPSPDYMGATAEVLPGRLADTVLAQFAPLSAQSREATHESIPGLEESRLRERLLVARVDTSPPSAGVVTDVAMTRPTVQEADAMEGLSLAPAAVQLPDPSLLFQARAAPKTVAAPRAPVLSQILHVQGPLQQQFRPVPDTVEHSAPEYYLEAQPVHTAPAAPEPTTDLQNTQQAFGHGLSAHDMHTTAEMRRPPGFFFPADMRRNGTATREHATNATSPAVDEDNQAESISEFAEGQVISL